jgi:hypothetical protein
MMAATANLEHFSTLGPFIYLPVLLVAEHIVFYEALFRGWNACLE